MKSFMGFSFWFMITTMIGFTGCERTSQSCPSKTESPQSASMAMLWNTLKKPKAQYSQNLFQLAASIPSDELVPFLKAKVQAEWKEVIDPPIVPLEPVTGKNLTPSKASDPNHGKIWREDIARRLNHPIDLNVTSATMADIVTELQTKVGVNFLLDSRTARDLGPITLKMSGVTAQKVLEQLMTLTKLKYTLKDEVVYISSQNDPGNLMTKTYDVSDLANGITSYVSPVISMPPNTNSETLLQFENNLPPIEDLIEIIKEVVPGNWDDPSRRLEPWQSGYLLIRQTPEVHEKINNLFGVFRESTARNKRFGPCTCVLIILDRIGTPDALAIVKEIWYKHSDEHIGDLAKNLLKNYGKKPFRISGF